MALLAEPVDNSSVEFVVLGLPVPQGSLIRTQHGVRHGNRERLLPWRQDVARAAWEAMQRRKLIAEAVAVDALFLLPRPKSHFGSGVSTRHAIRASAPVHPTTRPDLDKLTRALLDALEGVVFAHDAQVVDLHVSKRYGLPSLRCVVDIVDGGYAGGERIARGGDEMSETTEEEREERPKRVEDEQDLPEPEEGDEEAERPERPKPETEEEHETLGRPHEDG